jgi:hypothetical protein
MECLSPADITAFTLVKQERSPHMLTRNRRRAIDQESEKDATNIISSKLSVVKSRRFHSLILLVIELIKTAPKL